MNIFIDESGQFRTYENMTDNNNYECIVGVILNDQLLEEFEKLYGDKDKLFLRMHHKEIIELLIANNATAYAVIYDADLCVKDTIEKMRDDYINSIFEVKHQIF